VTCALTCRLLEVPVSQELRRALQAASSEYVSPQQHAAASAAVANAAAATDGRATAALRHRVAAPAALRLLQRLLGVLAAAAGVRVAGVAATGEEGCRNHPRSPALSLSVVQSTLPDTCGCTNCHLRASLGGCLPVACANAARLAGNRICRRQRGKTMSAHLCAGAGSCSAAARSAAAAVASKQFERLMAHSRLPALLLAPGADAAAGLPAAAEAVVPPLQSLLPLAGGTQQPQVRPSDCFK
jgi:hypothetical protein